MDGSSTLDEATPPEQLDMPDDDNAAHLPPDANGLTTGDPAAGDADDVPAIEPARVVEAVLLAAESPMTAAKIASVLGVGTARDVKKHIEALNADYDERGASFRIEELAGGFQLLTRPEYNTWLKKMLRVRQETKLSPAAMETLAIIAYKQPCTRAEIEAVRGVAVGDGVNRLREMNLVKIVGRAEDLGRPLLYGTTRKFLEVFGLPSLEDLPQVEALRPPPVAKTADEKAAAPTSDDSATNQPSDDVAAEGPPDNKPPLHIVREDDDPDAGEA